MAEDLAAELDAYAAAWGRIATDVIADFWRRDHFRFYKAEEVSEVFTEFPAVLAYLRGNERLHESVSLAFSGVLDLGIPGPARLVSAQMEWRIAFRQDARDSEGRVFRHAGKAMGGWNHVLSLWEEVDRRWYLTGWCEAPDAAPIYLADLYYRMAADSE
ncbi:hypothetical protein G6N82_04690 [Altererythrobacter sp. BO-6]|uniref:hypothetical protein n=1 Tax=Altererythrobacter sp. BO-6 TaxID=2604537 RepID=UPI0013E12BE4|nr:hypothetical protein [Altererythrobacter sp. BO-6]QIG53537.1 hypothetical protein G6N82_04690 [Altererythrobacter sp. BO-6]